MRFFRLPDKLKRTKLCRIGKIVLLSLSTMMSAVGCGLATQDAAHDNKVIKVGSAEAKCLATALDVMAKYFKSESQVKEVEQSWDCFSGALRAFMTNTTGQRTDSYKATEIRAFLEENFLDDVKITDGMLNEVMRLKQILMGGSVEIVTRKELNEAFEIISVLRTETVRLHPYIDIFSFSADVKAVQADPYRLELAVASFNVTIKNLAPFFLKASIDYGFNDLENLMKELKALMLSRENHGDSWKGPDYIIEHIPTVIAVKAFLLTPGPKAVHKHEWNGLLDNAGRLFSLYLRTHYLLADRDLLNGAGLEALTVTLNQFFDLVSDAVDAKPDKTVAFAQFDDIIDEAMRTKIITLNIPASTFKKLTRVFAQKVFTPPKAGKRSSSVGMTRPIFDRARESFFGWLDMQRVWEEVKNKAIAREPRLRGRAIPYETVRALWPTVPTRYKSNSEDIMHMLDRKPPLVISDEGTVVFDSAAGSLYGMTQWGFDSLNWKTHFARVVGMGWSADPVGNRYTGVTDKEFETFYYDVVELANALTLVEPGDKTIWKSSFEESNMFMLGADGNDRFSFDEGVDFIAYAMSSSVMVDLMYDDLRTGLYCDIVGADAFGRPMYETSCYRTRSQAKFIEYYDFLPTWTDLAKKLGPSRFPELQYALEKAAFKQGSETEKVSLSEVNKVSMVMQYLESLYVRFDVDHSGTINVHEARNAFPLFRSLLGQIKETEGMSEEDLLAVFMYVLHYKHAPANIFDKIFFQFVWRKSPSRWNSINIDRLAMVEILGQLKDLTRE